MIDFYGEQLNVYRASLHTHSTTSDGKMTPDEVLKYYADAGYDVVCMTDHRKTNNIAGLNHCGMLVISGVELHPTGGRIARSHLLCINVPEDFDVSVAEGGEEGSNLMQQVIDAVNAAGGLCYFAHPYWCGFRSTEAAELTGLAGIEVYNTSTRYIGRAYNMQFWDELCDMDILLPALAVDDAHKPRDLFGGWTMICSSDRSPESIVSALREGRYYATQGPEFKRISYKDGIFEAEFTPVTSVIGISNQCRGFCAGVPNFEGDGEAPEITSCRFETAKLNTAGKVPIECNYFRLQIIDAEGRHAWTNPIRIEQ